MIILQDTREKKPWDFTFHGFDQETFGLKTGDYSVKGCEHLVRIERKRSTGEIATNFGFKRKQFEAELERMMDFKYRYVLCEFPEEYIDMFPDKSGIPYAIRRKVRISAGFIRASIQNLSVKYGVDFLFARSISEAEEMAIEIFTRVVDEHTKNAS